MKRLLFSFLLTLPAGLRAQDDMTRQVTRNWLNSGGNLTTSSNSGVLPIKGPAGQRIGDPYLDSTFRTGYVVFYNRLQLPDGPPASVLRDVPIRLDLTTNEVEIRTKSQGIRAAPLPLVQAVGFQNPVSADTGWFVNSREYKPLPADDKASTGFFEQVAVGRLSLLRYHSIYVKKANYNAALNIGSSDEELKQVTDWYVAQGRQVQPFSPTKKSLISLMGDKAPEMDAWLKAKKPDLKSRDDLKAAFLYYNSL